MEDDIESYVRGIVIRHNLLLNNDAINTLILYTKIGGDVEALVGNPTYEYLDIFKEYLGLKKETTELG